MDKQKLETPIPLFSIDEYKKLHPLLKIEPREEDGVTQQFKTGYQKRLAVKKCLEMISLDSDIVSVSVELHEDYVVEFNDGSFDFCQVKHKDEGEEATFGTLVDALYNLFGYFKNNPEASNRFTIHTNREARSSQRKHGNLFELKHLLYRKEKYGLNPSEEHRLKGLKLNVHSLQKFQTEDYELVDKFIDRLIIKSDEDDVEAVKNDCKLKAQEILRLIHKTPYINLDVAEEFHNAIYFLVDQAGQEKDDRSRRIITRAMVEGKIPKAVELAELALPLSDEEEKNFHYDPDPKSTILEGKCKDAGLFSQVDILKEAKIVARNRNDQYKENPVAIRYISGLRLMLKSIHTYTRLELKTDHEQVYLRVMHELRQIERDQKDNDIRVRIDFNYLNGLYSQLISECKIHPAH